MKLMITGSRSITDIKFVFDELSNHTFDVLISGGARGIDKLAEQYAYQKRIVVDRRSP